MPTFDSSDDYAFRFYDTPPNDDVCSVIGSNLKVLDVGCSTGRIAEKLRREKNCFVVGLEVDGDLAKAAESRCDKVVVANVETTQSLEFSDGFFDVIIFADVLEHCRNPEEILSNLRRYLAEDGCVVISVPNVANWEVRLNLLKGRFDYKGGTILDNGHLRFFTLDSIKKLVENAGFRVEEVKTRNMVLKILGKLWKKLFAWGFVIKARKGKD